MKPPPKRKGVEGVNNYRRGFFKRGKTVGSDEEKRKNPASFRDVLYNVYKKKGKGALEGGKGEGGPLHSNKGGGVLHLIQRERNF